MNVVIAFPKIENAKSIRSILMKSGYQVDAVCTTGGQALQNVNALDGGILICGYRFADMTLVFTIPLSAAYFGVLSVVSPLSNLLVVPVAGWNFMAAFVTVLVGFVWLPAAKLLGQKS